MEDKKRSSHTGDIEGKLTPGRSVIHYSTEHQHEALMNNAVINSSCSSAGI